MTSTEYTDAPLALHLDPELGDPGPLRIQDQELGLHQAQYPGVVQQDPLGRAGAQGEPGAGGWGERRGLPGRSEFADGSGFPPHPTFGPHPEPGEHEQERLPRGVGEFDGLAIRTTVPIPPPRLANGPESGRTWFEAFKIPIPRLDRLETVPPGTKVALDVVRGGKKVRLGLEVAAGRDERRRQGEEPSTVQLRRIGCPFWAQASAAGRACDGC